MQAVSIKDPYASMIYERKKTIEIRTWKTKHRGKILLCASKEPQANLSGNAFAVAEIVDCRSMIKEDEEKACYGFRPGLYSWVLNNVQRIKLVPVTGRPALFEVDVSIVPLKNKTATTKQCVLTHF